MLAGKTNGSCQPLPSVPFGYQSGSKRLEITFGRLGLWKQSSCMILLNNIYIIYELIRSIYWCRLSWYAIRPVGQRYLLISNVIYFGSLLWWNDRNGSVCFWPFLETCHPEYSQYFLSYLISLAWRECIYYDNTQNFLFSFTISPFHTGQIYQWYHFVGYFFKPQPGISPCWHH
jgi:hypothetical protein